MSTRLYRRAQVGAGVKRVLAQLLQRGEDFLEVEWPGDVQFLDRSAIVEQHLKLDLGGAQVDEGGLHVGFELYALQLQAVEVHLGDIAGFEAVAAHGKRAVVEIETLACDGEHGFLLEHLDEGGAEVEQQVPSLVIQFRDGDGRTFLGALPPEGTLVPPFDEVAGGDERHGIGKRPVGIVGRGEGADLVDGHSEVRVGPQVGGNLVGAGFLNSDLAGAESSDWRHPIPAWPAPRSKFSAPGGWMP